jgi:hypothetical protein
MLKRSILILTTLAAALPAVAQSDAPLPEGAGKAVVQKMCVGCHKVKVITSKRATKEQWTTIVQQMVSRGADGTDEEIATVIDYLATNFPPLKEDKPAPPPASLALFEKSISPNAATQTSLLTISDANLNAMLHYWRQNSASHPNTAEQETHKNTSGD